MLKIPINVLMRALRHLATKEVNKVTIHEDGTIKIANWSKYQTEYERQRPYRRGLQGKVTKKGYSQKLQGDTDTDTDTEVDEDKKKKNGPARKPHGARLPDEDFIRLLKESPAYKGIDIDRELAKMDVWIVNHPGRKKTRRFIVNWLNKTDPSMGPGPDGMTEWLKKHGGKGGSR